MVKARTGKQLSTTPILRSASLLAGSGILALIVMACGSNGSTSPSTSGTQGLWVPNLNGSVTEFTRSMLTASGTPDPAVANLSSDLPEPVGIAFDKSNNLWVSNFVSGTLAEFTFAQLKGLVTINNPEAHVIISGLDEPRGLGFDAAGSLWAANFGNDTLVKFNADQLIAGGDQTPDVTITSSTLSEPARLVFDKAGRLWVANESASSLALFTRHQLATGGYQNPAVLISSNSSGSLSRPRGITLDAAGNLWVANYVGGANNLGTVVEFAAADLDVSGSPNPAVTISSTPVGETNSINGCRGVAFDRNGNLWVSNFFSDQFGSVAEFTKHQIRTGGSPTPAVFLDSNAQGSNINQPELITFGPSIK
jgi:ligand-binding sensor domain-containing protein